MDNKTNIIIGTLAIVVLSVSFFAFKRPVIVNVPEIKVPEQSQSLGNISLLTTASNCTGISTTTAPYNTAAYIKSGTTTVTIPGGYSVVSTNFAAISTTTPILLGYHYEVSNDGIDWYASGLPVSIPPTQVTSTTTQNVQSDYIISFASSTKLLGTSLFSAPTTTVFQQVSPVTVYGKQARLQFYLRPTSASGAVCAEVLIQRNSGY